MLCKNKSNECAGKKDALSSYEFYKHGLVDKPVPGNDEIDLFFQNGLTDMWVYYCTAQCVDVSNRFMSMPSARNRIYGIQIYKIGRASCRERV